MQRRDWLRLCAASAAFGVGESPAARDAHVQFLKPTPYIDSDHPQIQATAAQVAPSELDPFERAVRIHDHVRDRVKFGWASDFYDQAASEVLASGTGFCNTKATLFAALLRASGIPARQHFVDIDARILFPFIDPGTPYVDHSFVEVWLGDRWCATDSYVVDLALHRVATRRLRGRPQALGFGVHRDGSSHWDGRSDRFSQFLRSPEGPPITTRDHGIHEDVGAFYASGKGINRLNPFLKLGFGFFARAANQRIEAVRRDA